MGDPDDDILVRRAVDGSPEAIAALFARHWAGAWRAVYGITGSRALADDVAQDGFERAIRHLDRLEVGRPFAPWLHRIVVNRGRDVMRRERRSVGSGPLEALAGEDAQGDVVERARARAAIAGLSLERRTVVVLHYWLGYSLAEVAGLLEIPLGTVHSRMGRALAELRRALEAADAGRPR
ncbi:MAG: RNA polymerase sigma factor [Thermoleophilia bacterium]